MPCPLRVKEVALLEVSVNRKVGLSCRWAVGLGAILLLAGCLSAPPQPLRPFAATEARLGVEVIGLREASGGYMLDFRYKLLDAAKAAPLFDRETIPYLIHERSGAQFAIPAPAKVGPLRQMPRQPVAGKQYFIFFANPGKYVKQGDAVTVVVGDLRFEHVIVE